MNFMQFINEVEILSKSKITSKSKQLRDTSMADQRGKQLAANQKLREKPVQAISEQFLDKFKKSIENKENLSTLKQMCIKELEANIANKECLKKTTNEINKHETEASLIVHVYNIFLCTKGYRVDKPL